MVKIDLYAAQAVIRAQQVLTVGLVGVPVRFAFSDAWQCLSKVAVFRQGEVTVDVALPGNLAVMPWEVLQEPGVPVQIGVYGMDAQGKIVIPTVWAVTEPVQPAADPNAGENLEPASPLWQQILTLIGSPDQLDTREKQTLVQAINEANRAVHLVTLTPEGLLRNAGQPLLDALEAGKLPLCHWEQEDVYLPLTHWVSDVDMTFSGILRGREYFVSCNPRDSQLYRCSAATLGGGGVYVGSQEPKDESILLWVDPEKDTQSDLVRRMDVTVARQNGHWVADHYFDVIAEKLDQGYLVSCLLDTGVYGLIARGSNQVIFGSFRGDANTQIRIGKSGSNASVVVTESDFVMAPDVAAPGQVMAVKSVDSTGKPTAWEPSALPVVPEWKLLAEGELTQDCQQFIVATDQEGNPFSVSEVLIQFEAVPGSANEVKGTVRLFFNGAWKDECYDFIDALPVGAPTTGSLYRNFSEGMLAPAFFGDSGGASERLTMVKAEGPRDIRSIMFYSYNTALQFGVGTKYTVLYKENRREAGV